ncbi:hypothetical protein GCM10019071_11560 [Sphingobium fuliginis]|uniref:Uncharacterized protein n=1 Tax=Sphingobium fuliginis (strain ATCC 27551) TaxID=336203 RepID=A0ABQ1ERT2_SPHSA|nr:hypothetical protein GCM10019071_11560 [Sphingobium fuliginis]
MMDRPQRIGNGPTPPAKWDIARSIWKVPNIPTDRNARTNITGPTFMQPSLRRTRKACVPSP